MAFRLMVALGLLMVATGIVGLVVRLRGKIFLIGRIFQSLINPV